MVPKVPLHNQGLELSRIVVGLMNLADWKLSPKDLQSWVSSCLEMGLETFDLADIYGGYTCEGLFGQLLAKQPALRKQIQIVTKCGIRSTRNRPQYRLPYYDSDTGYLESAVDASLKVLHTDYIDLLLIHRPDPLMSPEHVADLFERLAREGKVLHFGVSNFTPSQFEMLQSYLARPLVTNQIEISLMHLEPLYDGTLDQCLQKRIKPMAWSPLAGGRLFGGTHERSARIRETLQRLLPQTGAQSMDQLALAWLLRHPAGILPVLGTGKLERIRAAVESLNIKLDTQDWYDLLKASVGSDVV
jgi:predicted oxidoreductase